MEQAGHLLAPALRCLRVPSAQLRRALFSSLDVRDDRVQAVLRVKDFQIELQTLSKKREWFNRNCPAANARETHS